jgi:hypothetical protein
MLEEEWTTSPKTRSSRSTAKVNIEVQARDGVLKELLPPLERYVGQNYIKQAQRN